MDNVRKLITEADGYQPHLIAPEQGYRRLIESCLVSIRGPAEAAVDAVHSILKDLIHKSIGETSVIKISLNISQNHKLLNKNTFCPHRLCVTSHQNRN